MILFLPYIFPSTMISLTFEVYKFDRYAQEVLLTTISVECDPNDCQNILQVSQTLKFLYPQAFGVRVTIV